MDNWLEIRQRVLIEGVSRRQICRETGMHWQTLEKILACPSPPGYQRTAPIAKPKMHPVLGGEVVERQQLRSVLLQALGRRGILLTERLAEHIERLVRRRLGLGDPDLAEHRLDSAVQ